MRIKHVFVLNPGQSFKYSFCFDTFESLQNWIYSISFIYSLEVVQTITKLLSERLSDNKILGIKKTII